MVWIVLGVAMDRDGYRPHSEIELLQKRSITRSTHSKRSRFESHSLYSIYKPTESNTLNYAPVYISLDLLPSSHLMTTHLQKPFHKRLRNPRRGRIFLGTEVFHQLTQLLPIIQGFLFFPQSISPLSSFASRGISCSYLKLRMTLKQQHINDF